MSTKVSIHSIEHFTASAHEDIGQYQWITLEFKQESKAYADVTLYFDTREKWAEAARQFGCVPMYSMSKDTWSGLPAELPANPPATSGGE